MKQLVYVIGEPGVGKSTAVRDATAQWMRGEESLAPEGQGPWPRREGLFIPGERRLVAVELGYRRDAFSGTDALPMNATVNAERYLREQSETELIIGEGARLATVRFLAEALYTEYHLRLVWLTCSDDTAALRRMRRGSKQNPAWIKGQRTRMNNLFHVFLNWGDQTHITLYHADANQEGTGDAAVRRALADALTRGAV